MNRHDKPRFAVTIGKNAVTRYAVTRWVEVYCDSYCILALQLLVLLGQRQAIKNPPLYESRRVLGKLGCCWSVIWCPEPESNRHDISVERFYLPLRLSPPLSRLWSGLYLHHIASDLGAPRQVSTPS